MKTQKIPAFALAFFSLAALLFLVACSTSEESGRVLNMHIDKNNDSLMTFDSLIVKVYSKDSSGTQIVFHGKLTDPKQVLGMPLDPRMSEEYTVSIVGYKGGKVGVNKEITILGQNNFTSKDLPVQTGKDTVVIVVIEPAIPEILAPSDTTVAEGDSLRFRVSVHNPLSGATTLTLKDTLPGAALDTVGRDPGDGYFTWRPNYNQGRSEPYAVTFVYASAGRRVEKIARVKVLNVNRPPKLVAIADQKVKENETLTFKVEATDPDQDSLTLTSSVLPVGATFSSGSFSWKTTVGQAGNYSIKFKAFDGKDSDLVAVLITVGNVDVSPALEVKITSPARDTLINFTPITILYTVNGTFLQKKIPLKDGKNKIFIDTTVAGRTALDTITITLDTVPPGKPTVNGASPVRTLTPSWTWSSGGNGNGTYRYRLDNGDMASATIVSDTAYASPKDLDPGTHTLFVQERDAAGNWSQSGKRTVRIDTTRPAPPTVTAEPSPTKNIQPSWSWQSADDDVTGLFRYKLDNADLRTDATETKVASYMPKTGEELKEGLHTLYVQQQDSAGNWSNSGSASIRVDLTPPSAPQVKADQVSPTKITKPGWSWTSGGNGGIGTYRLKLDDSILTTGAISGSSLGFIPDTALKEGSHTLYVQERDSAGNWSTSGQETVRIDLTPPAAPIFDSQPESPLNSLQPTWTWKTGGSGGNGIYRCKLDDVRLEDGGILVKTNSFLAPMILSAALHTLYIQEADSAGNWSPPAAKTLALSVRETVGAPGFSAGSVAYISQVITSAGVPYVAFSDNANGSKATVMRFNGTAWEPVGNRGFSAGGVGFCSLAFNDAGVPHVAFSDGGNGYKATVMRFNGTVWEPVGRPGFTVGGTQYTSLAFNGAGVPYVAFQDNANGNKATVMRFNGTVWEPVGTSGFSADGANYTSLAINGAGVPYVAFTNDANGNKAAVMRFNGSAWEAVGNIGISAGWATYTSLALNGTGVPYVAFADNANGDKAAVMRFNGSAWEAVGNIGISAGKANCTSLAFNGAGVPHVAFADDANGNRAAVMRLNGSAWEAVGNTGISAGGATYTSLALNSTGVPYVAFTDYTNGSKITVIKTSFNP